MSELEGRSRPTFADAALYLVGVAGMSACLTLAFLGMRAVMNVGGYCAEGGPYVIDTPCPEGVPLLLTGGIFGLFGFGGVMLWKGSAIGGPYAALTALAWPALFLSLGWNFLEYALNPPGPPGQGIVWGWLIPGVIFVLMGGVPLAVALPLGRSGRSVATRPRPPTTLATNVAPRDRRAQPVNNLRQANLRRLANALDALRDRAAAEADNAGLVDELERLAALHRAGDIDDLEFEQAKRILLASQ